MNEFLTLQQAAGIHFMGVDPVMLDENHPYGKNFQLAMDAQPGLVTVSNSGIPAYLSTYVDPRVIEAIVAPTNAVEAVGNEAKKGDWETPTTSFIFVESTGQTSTYGDYNNSGTAGVNTNFPQRQSYHYQVMTEWGELEMARAGMAKIDLAARKNIASVETLNQKQNLTYIFGVSGLQNYGMLNDPSLSAPLTPSTKAAGGTGWVKADGITPNATAPEVVNDIRTMYGKLQLQLDGNLELNSDMDLIIPNSVEVAMTFTTEYNTQSVISLLKQAFPNLKVKTVPQYATASGNQIQLVSNNIRGQRTWDCCFTEKLRAHPIIPGNSSFSQKKSQGTWGTVIYFPAAISGMLGV